MGSMHIPNLMKLSLMVRKLSNVKLGISANSIIRWPLKGHMVGIAECTNDENCSIKWALSIIRISSAYLQPREDHGPFRSFLRNGTVSCSQGCHLKTVVASLKDSATIEGQIVSRICTRKLVVLVTIATAPDWDCEQYGFRAVLRPLLGKRGSQSNSYYLQYTRSWYTPTTRVLSKSVKNCDLGIGKCLKIYIRPT